MVGKVARTSCILSYIMIPNQQQNDTLDFSNKSHVHLFKGIFNISPMPGTMIGIAYILYIIVVISTQSLIHVQFFCMDCSLPSFLCPRDFPGKNIGGGCHFLLQEIFLIRGSNPRLLQRQVSSFGYIVASAIFS